uniref:Uncharacterized protein n=1 Tax=Entomoneis paludosa TaxID=265537 RepID=A0A7S3DWJ7_9STRA|mmetsp:Transcript_520/g.1218  ORF Transcript_520/g.1218 Transcript_520/m.1218 type:complete len:245 (+) Transcript_520:402-1136(+)
MLAYLEWAYWEVLTLVIGTLGVLPLSAHTIPRQVTDIGYVVPVGMGLALAIRLGATISKNVRRAQAMALGMLVLSIVLFGTVSMMAYLCRGYIIEFFTTESQVVEICNEIWWSACAYFFLTSLFGINMGVSIGLGMQWTFGVVTVICMWMIGMPGTYYFAIVRHGGLAAVWHCIWPPYLLINVAMWTIFVWKDWESVANKIRNEGASDDSSLSKKHIDIEAGMIDSSSRTSRHPDETEGGHKRK